MRISKLTAYHVRIPLRKKIRHASHTRHDTDSLIVRCQLDDGVIGWGEGLPRPYVTGETIESVWEQWGATNFTGQLAGTIQDLADVVDRLDSFQLAPSPADARDCFGNSLRCALELSLLDAAARTSDVPLSHVTKLIPEAAAIRETSEKVRYSMAITAMSPLRTSIRAAMMRYYGFQFAKVKVGVEDVDDASCLARIRWLVGKDFDLRIDANEAWTCENLEARLQPLLPFRITSIEQPVPHDAVDGLAAIRPRLDVPIMLDESLCSVSDAHRAIERGTCDLFNIRLSKCGGFVASLRLAATAHRAGLGYQLGCQVGETGILSAAGRHFATSVGQIRYLEGSFDRFLVKEPLIREDITFGRGGMAPALTGPGLGITPDLPALKRVTIAERHIAIE